jgi:hypothetical protein
MCGFSFVPEAGIILAYISAIPWQSESLTVYDFMKNPYPFSNKEIE